MLVTASEAVRDVLFSWIIDAYVPFSVVEHAQFYTLLSLLNCDLTTILILESS